MCRAARLRRRKPTVTGASAPSTSFINRRHGDPDKRFGPAGELADFDRDGDQRHQHECDLERKRRRRRKRIQRNNNDVRRIHRSGRSALVTDCASYSNEPGGLDEIGDSATRHHERDRDQHCAAQCQRRTWRHVGVSRSDQQRGASGHFGALEPQRCGMPAACGSVDLSGHYTAPGTLPSIATATITAQSVADPTKQASAPLNITSNFALQVTAPQTVPAGGTATIVATMTPVAGSNPSTALAWSLSGPGCSSTTCGTLSVVTTQGCGGTVTADTATYTASTTPPNPASVTVTVTPQADPTKKAQATMAVQAGVNVSLTPATDTLAANHRVTLTAQVFGTTNTGVNWSVGGISDGNTMLGQICVVGSSPCQSVTSGSALQVDYLAAETIPQPNPVSVVATSAADATKSAAAQITVINHVLVSVQPASFTLAPLAVEGFTATVLGTSNQSVVWQIQGTACANSGVCGAIDANGNYTAPGSAPTPDALQVVAVSSDDTTQSGAANVTISTGANILSLHPASVYDGAADGFTLLVEGSGFTSSSPGPGSTLMIAGTARTTTCLASTECSAPVAAVDVSVAGNLSVQIQNPGGTASNAVSLVVAPPNTSNDVIALSSASPNAAGKDIVVVDPTTAGVSAQGNDVDLNVAALGMFSVASNSCSLSGNPLRSLGRRAGARHSISARSPKADWTPA
jgi:hypothetical protein